MADSLYEETREEIAQNIAEAKAQLEALTQDAMAYASRLSERYDHGPLAAHPVWGDEWQAIAREERWGEGGAPRVPYETDPRYATITRWEWEVMHPHAETALAHERAEWARIVEEFGGSEHELDTGAPSAQARSTLDRFQQEVQQLRDQGIAAPEPSQEQGHGYGR